MEVNGKVVLVTGGGSGIGAAIAAALADRGCRVAIAGRDLGKLERVASTYAGPSPLWCYACDVSDRAAVERLCHAVRQEVGAPTILVNSAGVNVARRSMADLDPADWDRMMAINATGAYNCIRAVLPDMRQHRSGLIINISSISGKRVMRLGGVAYCASKFALSALGAGVAMDEREHGVRVTNIYPGEVATPILANRPTPVSPERLSQMLQPEDVARMVLAVVDLPERAVVPELVITPMYQEYA